MRVRRRIVVIRNGKTLRGRRALMKFVFALGLFTFGSVLLTAAYMYKVSRTETRDLTRERIFQTLAEMKPPTVFLSRSGEISAELFERYREDVRFDEIPLHVVKAFLAAEDADFFKHRGVDLSSLLRATLKNIVEGRIVQGGSTISQQLARNLFLTRERTIKRKIKEIIYAVKLEQELTKEEIFSIYVSLIYFGNGSWGIKAAARNFFKKNIKDLTIAEAALLASLPKSPVYYSPINHPERARARQLWVLERMLKLGFISSREFEKAVSERIKIHAWESKFHRYFWFNEHIRRELMKLAKDSYDMKSGYVVRTTLDEFCYIHAEEALRWGIERAELLNDRKPATSLERVSQNLRVRELVFPDGPKTYEGKENHLAKVVEVSNRGVLISIPGSGRVSSIHPDFSQIGFRPGDEVVVRQCPDERYYCPVPERVDIEGAMVVMDATTGDVLCMIGGYDWRRSQFIRAVQAKRQVGSTIKPVVYTAAIRSGLYNPATVIKDAPIVFDYNTEEGDVREWKPKNIESFRGWVTLQEALAKSINAATVRVAENIGLDAIRKTFEDFGISVPVEDLTVSLGSISLSPVDVAEIFSTFPNGGKRKRARFMTTVEKEGGRIFEEQVWEQEVIPQDISFVVTWMMRNAVLHGTGARANSLGIPVAGKTGTTNDLKDAWFVGFTPDLIVVIWIGRDDFRMIGKNASGSRLAVPVFVEFMRKYMARIKKRDFEIPENIEFLKVDPITGELSDGPRAYIMAFTRDSLPVQQDGGADFSPSPSEEQIDF